MQKWTKGLNDDPLPWLLEPDLKNPGGRYFALTDLMDHPLDDPEVREARRSVMMTGPVPTILQAQECEGYWVEPGPGYNPKYRSIVWSVSMLAQLGADGSDSGNITNWFRFTPWMKPMLPPWLRSCSLLGYYLTEQSFHTVWRIVRRVSSSIFTLYPWHANVL